MVALLGKYEWKDKQINIKMADQFLGLPKVLHLFYLKVLRRLRSFLYKFFPVQ